MPKSNLSPTPDVTGNTPGKSSALSFVKKKTETVKIPASADEPESTAESVIPIPVEPTSKAQTTARKTRSIASDRESLPFNANVSSRVREDIRQRLEHERHLRTLEAAAQSRLHRPQYIIDEVLHLGLQQLEKRRSK